LIGQVAVGAVNLDAIETRTQRAFGTGSELLDDARDLMQFEGARDRERRFAITLATSPEIALLNSAARSWSTIRSSRLKRCGSLSTRFASFYIIKRRLTRPRATLVLAFRHSKAMESE